MTSPTAARIAHIALNVHDLDRSVDFYVGALAFTVEARTTDRARLTLGAERIELAWRPDAAPYPEPRAANDPWFQHFAISVSDMTAAYGRLSRFAPEPISHGGPQLLPPSTGSVTAYKFRDPDGHPLELSYVPGGSSSRAEGRDGAVFLAIDHTALAVRDLEESVAFYTGLGFRLGERFLNQGPEQARLDGLDGATVDIVTLLTPDAGPHIELLHYRSPAPRRPPIKMTPDDIAATCTVLAPCVSARASGDADASAWRRDPDGHLLRFAS